MSNVRPRRLPKGVCGRYCGVWPEHSRSCQNWKVMIEWGPLNVNGERCDGAWRSRPNYRSRHCRRHGQKRIDRHPQNVDLEVN